MIDLSVVYVLIFLENRSFKLASATDLIPADMQSLRMVPSSLLLFGLYILHIRNWTVQANACSGS